MVPVGLLLHNNYPELPCNEPPEVPSRSRWTDAPTSCPLPRGLLLRRSLREEEDPFCPESIGLALCLVLERCGSWILRAEGRHWPLLLTTSRHAMQDPHAVMSEEQHGDSPEGGDDWNNDDYLSLEVEGDDEGVDDTVRKNGSIEGENNNDDDGAMDVSDDVDDDDAPNTDADGNPLPPWMDRPRHDDGGDRRNGGADGRGGRRRYVHPLTALHNEVVGFARLLEPTRDEVRQRESVVDRIRDVVRVEFGDAAQVEVFGSQATGLFLPSSDIDVVVLTGESEETATGEGSVAGNRAQHKPGHSTSSNNRNPEGDDDENGDDDWEPTSRRGSPLQRFAAAVRDRWTPEPPSYLEVIENTRVPLVKFTDASTNISVDVSFDIPTGPPAARLMRTYLEALPALRPLTLVLKAFLAARGLHQAYTGGIGSYALQLMIVSFLQQRERDAVEHRRQSSALNLGALLLEFAEFYGLEFNYWTTGISVRHDGFFFPKGARKDAFFEPDRPFLLALENPLDPAMDVGRPSFRVQTVQRALKVAHNTLLAHVAEPACPAPSILATILPPTDEMVQRRRQALKRQRRNLPTTSLVDRPLAAQRSAGWTDQQQPPPGGNRHRRKRRRRN